MNRKNTKFIFLAILFFALFGLAESAWAATIDAASCSQADVQEAINSSSDGDTVSVPAGSCVWTSAVTASNKSFDLIGAGAGLTNIIDNTPSGWGNDPLWITTIDGKGVRISGFSFDGSSGGNIIRILGTSKTIRIDHNTFSDCGFAVTLGNTGSNNSEIWGVIDNNVFTKTDSGPVGSILLFGDIDRWNDPLLIGSGDALFIEDNTFDYPSQKDSAIQSVSGSRYVFRNNSVTNTVIDAHGPDSTKISSVLWEAYGNSFNCDIAGGCGVIAFMRGGTGVIHNNSFTGNYSPDGMQLMYYRSCFNESECVSFHNPASPSWGHCDVEFTRNNSRCDGDAAIDGNEDGTGWPCREQPGTSSIGSDPAYEWNNILNGEDVDWYVKTGCTNPDIRDHIQENRDFYNDTQRPGYVVYTYPHPLRGEGADTTPPAAPSGLSVN